jgi:hypothetical protein
MIILGNKNFARADYEGLTKREAEILKGKRKAVADSIRNTRASGLKGIIFGKPVKDALRQSAISDARKELLDSKYKILNGETKVITPVKEKLTKRVGNFIKNHKMAMGSAAMSGALAGAATLAYTHYKKKKQNQSK